MSLPIYAMRAAYSTPSKKSAERNRADRPACELHIQSRLDHNSARSFVGRQREKNGTDGSGRRISDSYERPKMEDGPHAETHSMSPQCGPRASIRVRRRRADSYDPES